MGWNQKKQRTTSHEQPYHQYYARSQANINHSGIFGYINYLVEKDRKFITDTLINGMCALFFAPPFLCLAPLVGGAVSSILANMRSGIFQLGLRLPTNASNSRPLLS